MNVPLTLMSDGYCVQLENLALHGAPFRRMRFASMFALLQHPGVGPVLFDTGYTQRFFEETRALPGRFYALITPTHVLSEQAVASQLQARQIAPEEVRHVIISHFHADHVGGLRDFPNARFHCTRAAVDAVRSLRGWRAVRHAFLPGLLPPDFYERVNCVEDAPMVRLPASHQPFKEAWDLLGDGSLLAVELPGHATGQMGLFVTNAAGRDCLLAADACWLGRACRENRLPHPLVRLLVDWIAYRDTLQKLHELHHANPSLWIIPSHCPEIWEAKS